jgi:SNF2-related domain
MRALATERDPKPNPFVRERTLKDGTIALYDRLTRGRLQKAHAPARGSILADEMGLGVGASIWISPIDYDSLLCILVIGPSWPSLSSRTENATVQTISLILSHPPEGYQYGKSDGDEIDAGIWTLIVCPKSVISNWLATANRFDSFVKENTFRVRVYEGTPKQRTKICAAVMENQVDILLSS